MVAGVEGTAGLGAAVGVAVKLGVGVGITVEVAGMVELGLVSENTAVGVGAMVVEVTGIPWSPQATKIPSMATIPKDANRMHRLPNPPTYISCLRMRQPPLLEWAVTQVSRLATGPVFFSIYESTLEP